MNSAVQFRADFRAAVERLVPRILTQACRDPNSPAYGAFDRDWWHYRIRDFPSVILQQGAYAVWLAGRLPGWEPRQEALAQLAAAACRFWNSRAVRRGAFEEYYPWEEGYAPLAFSTLAVMRLADAGVVPAADLRAGAARAARQLLARFEPEAANQQVAGLAALAWIAKVMPDLVPQAEFDALSRRTLALQDDEGWFEEYGGPDLAYLSVAMDRLWDLFDATGQPAYVAAAERALDFMAHYVPLTGASIGMQNSRNTDYILPYGLARFMTDRPAKRALAAALVRRLYAGILSPSHFLHAVDDRYLCHYTGHSFVRACLLFDGAEGIDALLESAPELAPAAECWLPHCGHYIRGGVPADRGYSLVCSLRKGGVLTAAKGTARVSDFGWVVESGGEQFVNHWWSRDWTFTRDRGAMSVRGFLMPHREQLSSPLKHAALRVLSFCFGHRLIPKLKSILIFKNRPSAFAFERRIEETDAGIVVRDRISGLPGGAQVRPAPRSSKRHVSSADSFHAEDLALRDGVQMARTERLADGVFEAETTYTFP